MYEEDLTLNNLQQLICHKTKPNQIFTKSICEKNLTKVIVMYRKPWWLFYKQFHMEISVFSLGYHLTVIFYLQHILHKCFQ